MRRIRCLLFFALLFGTTVHAQRWRQVERNPMTILSPSGKAKLWVNPSDPSGKGSAFCSVTIGGKLAWQKNLPFTFHEVAISDAGLVGGYAYTEGEEGLGSFVVALLDPKGVVVFKEATKRKNSRFFHTAPDPKVSEFVFDAPNDRMIVEVTGDDLNTGTVAWWTYQLSARKRVANRYPEGKSRTLGLWMNQAMAIRGSNLLATNWYRLDEKDRMGQFFTLVDEDAKPVWRLDIPGDYEPLDAKPERRYDVREEAMRKGTILGSPGPNRFEVRLVKQAQRVTFEISREKGKVQVREVSRKPYTEIKPKTPPPLQTKMVTLKVANKLVLPRAAEPKAEVRDVIVFHFMERDRIVFLRDRAAPDVCVVDLSGKLVRRIPLPKQALQRDAELFLAKCAGSRFILAATVAGEKDRSYAWRLDAATGKLSPITAFKSFKIDSIAAYPDGRLAVVSTEYPPFTVAHHLSLYSADGKLLWTQGDAGYGGEDQEMISPEDVHIDSKGRIVVLDNIRHTLHHFKSDGSFEKFIDLDKKWKGDSHYPTEVTCRPDGKFWVYDFGSEETCYDLDPSGTVLRLFKPTYTSGKAFEVYGSIEVDSQGRSWVTNGASFFRLDANGRVDRTVGNPPRVAGLGHIEKIHVGLDGRVFALDRLTCGVHVFTAKGQKQFVAMPKPKEFEDDSVGPWFDITRSGDIFLYGTRSGNTVRFSPTGRRLPDLPDRGWGDRLGPEKPFTMRPTWRWRGSNLVDERDKTVATLRRWPDLSWSSGPQAIAPDGRMMSSQGESTEGKSKLAFYAANGTPESQVTLPPGMPGSHGSAFDGKLCYFVTEKGLIAVDRNGKALWTYRPKGWGYSWQVFPSLGKLALFDGDRTIYWVAVTG